MLKHTVNTALFSRSASAPSPSENATRDKSALHVLDPNCRNGMIGQRNPLTGLSQQANKCVAGILQPPEPLARRQQSQDHLSLDPLTEQPPGFPQTPVRGGISRNIFLDPSHDITEATPTSTPADRITWNYKPNSSAATAPEDQEATNFVSTLSQTSVTRPIVSRHFVTPVVAADAHKQAEVQGTPPADPIDAAWSRLLHDKQTPHKPMAAVPRKLLRSSSPPSPIRDSRAMGVLGLRRTKSCTTDWPESPAKRRKTRPSSSQGVDMSSGPNTRVLVDIIHGELENSTRKRKRTHSPSSSLRVFDKTSTSIIPVDKTSPSIIPVDKTSTSIIPVVPSERNAPYAAQDNRLHVPKDLLTIDLSTRTIPQPELVPMQAPAQEQKASACSDEDDCFDNEMSEDFEACFQDLVTRAERVTAFGDEEPVPRQVEPKHEHQLPTGSGRSVAEGLKDDVVPPTNAKEASWAHQQSPNQHRESLQGHTIDDDEFDDYGDCDAADLESLFAKLEESQLDKMPSVALNVTVTEVDPSISRVDEVRLDDRTRAETSRSVSAVDVSSDDEFGVDADFDDLAIEYAQATPETYGTSRNDVMVHRHQILTVTESTYMTTKGHKRPEKILSVEAEKTNTRKVVTLRDSWVESPCTAGSFIHVLGQFDRYGHCTIDDAQNMLILHPDHLISATVVADSFSCTRRAVLQDRVKATNAPGESQVYGNILHEVFQEAMKANRWDLEWLTSTVERIAIRFLETLYEIGVEMAQALEHLMSKMPEMQSWAEVFVRARPHREAVVKDRNDTHALMAVNKLLAVEEHIWSPTFGLKGNVDATVQVVMKDGNNEKTLTVPFEVKTGKNFSNAAHKAQTALYTLLLSDRYDVHIAYGVLYYMETSEISRIPAVRHELRHMIMQRNDLACYVRQRLELPPMLRSPHLCGKCYANTSCFIYHKLIDDGTGESSGMKGKFDEAVKHLTPIHQEFFKKWDDLLTKEEKDALKFRRELWTMLSSEREKVGRCFGSVMVSPGSAVELPDGPKINRFMYTFVKSKPSAGFSFTDSQIIAGEPIVISDEVGHFALANGYATKVRRECITVAVDRPLGKARLRRKKFDVDTYQSFNGIMEIPGGSQEPTTSVGHDSEDPVLYRVDKDEFSNGMAQVRNNLIRIMERDLFGSRALRRLIIEGVAPTFKCLEAGKVEYASQLSLNSDQRSAIEKVMSARDYALVLGMPGTGKTTTIAHLIRALAAQGKSILLTSYTHTAVDNILLKIRHDGLGILRIGAVAKIHPEVQQFADLAAIPKTTVEELKNAYSKQVVGTTCLGINHPVFNQRVFDYCIVDEASQITLPVCLGPIRLARTFILVGDHYQLPPLVQNKEAREGGLNISLFKLLSDTHPSSVVNLEHQYRMCAEIMSLSNTLIYDGRLKCGTSLVANRSMRVEKMNALSSHHHTPTTLPPSQKAFCPGPIPGTCWLRDVLDPAAKVVFLNTDRFLASSREVARGSRITNPLEVTMTTQIVSALLTIGVPAPDIGVITFYRSQLALLKQSLRTSFSYASHARDAHSAVEMHTADKFQGRDKEVVVLSMVRSNEDGNLGDLLKDWRRVNVALTRARTKLILCGSFETLRKGSELLGKLCGLVQVNGWKLDLKEGDLGSHYFEDHMTQCSVPKTAVGTGTSMDVTLEKERQPRDSKIRSPAKRKGLDSRTLLGSRPVMRDIVNEATG